MHITQVKGPKAALQFATQQLTKFTLKDFLNYAGVFLLFLVLYAGLYMCIGKPFVPGPQGSAWAIMIIWLGAMIGAFLAELVNIPGPVGMICSGLFLKNVAGGILIEGLKPSWNKEIRAAALAIIFLRSGLELDLSIFKRAGVTALKLLFIPGLCEAFFTGGLAIAMFGMPVTFGFALGFILKAVGPALVIQLMFETQAQRLGTAKEIPTTIVAAASFDDSIAITGYTIFISIAVQGSSNAGWHIAQGPLSVVFGALLGLAVAVACSFTQLWNTGYKRSAVTILAALAMKYFFDKFNFESGGALAALTLGLTVKELWRRKWPRFLALQDDYPPDSIRQVEEHVRFLWRFLLMPLLFGLVGTLVALKTLPSNTIPQAVGLICAGLAVRMVVTFFTMATCKQFLWREVLFFTVAWIPKATVQAALGALPLDAVQKAYPKGSVNYIEYTRWAEDALTVAVFEILISGTLGCLFVRWLSPFLLTVDDDSNASRHMRSSSRKMAVNEDGLESGGVMPVMGLEELGEKHDLVAHHLGRMDSLAHAIDNEQSDEGAHEYAATLLAGVHQLRQRLEAELDPSSVIGADDFVRATNELRRRGSRHGAGGSSGQLPPLSPSQSQPQLQTELVEQPHDAHVASSA